jgi:hypothetical protein
VYLTAMTGEPLYRSHIDFNHDVIDRFAAFALVKAEGRWIDNEGNLAVSVYIDPFLTLFVSQKYPLLFWFAVPAAIAAWRRRQTPAGHALVLLMGMGLTSFVFVAANPKLLLVPRYFIVVAWAAAMVAGWGLASAWEVGRRRAAIAGLAIIGLAGTVALGVENTDPRVVEREMVRWVAAHPGGNLHTDVITANKAGYFLRFANLPRSKITHDKPAPGDVFFTCEQCLRRCQGAPTCRTRADDFMPQSNWTVLEHVDGPRKPLAKLAEILRLDRVLPVDIAQRFLAPTARMTIYEVH